MRGAPPAARRGLAYGALVLLTAGCALTARVPAEGAGLRVAFVACAVAGSVLVLGVSRWTRPSARFVLLLALVLRALVFPLPPALSDDAYRYVWDGKVQAEEDINPYRFRPSDVQLEHLHESPVFDRLNSPRYYSVYPPGSQLVFRLGHLIAGGDERVVYYAIKLLITGAEIIGIALLLRMALPGAALLYAWHPLAVIEVAGQGHTEGLAVLGLILSAWAVARRRGGIAGGALAFAGWVKLVPFFLLPFVWRRLGWRAVGGAGLVILAGAAPFAAAYVIPNTRESLGLYVRLFEFAGGPYLALKGLARLLGFGDAGKILGPLLQLTFFAGLVGLLAREWNRCPPYVASASAVLGLFLATATTVHPWYLLPGLALAPLLGRPWPWVWAASVAPLTYLHYTGPLWASEWAIAVGWMGVGGLVTWPYRRAMLDRMLRRRARWKWAWIAREIGPVPAPAAILDLGAGEGFVGEAAARETGTRVVLADVAPLNRTTLPHVTYNGVRLPFASDSFELVLLVFVLHHARDPEAVIAEAARVGRRVVVVESVPERARVVVEAIDRHVNRLRGPALREQERWLRMRPASAWRTAFSHAGLLVARESRRGRWVHPQALFVLEPDNRYCKQTTSYDERPPNHVS